MSIIVYVSFFFFFFFKQKTAYDMRISDWSSDVCSSDLPLSATKCLVAGKGGSFMSDGPVQRQSVERLPDQRSTLLTDELNKILDMLTSACPEGAIISFDFDGKQIGRAHV